MTKYPAYSEQEHEVDIEEADKPEPAKEACIHGIDLDQECSKCEQLENPGPYYWSIFK